MNIAAVVVTDLNNAIGKDNQLLCHLPADLKYFKKVTMGFPIIMGRKTFDSIGRILPGRRNLIISRKEDLQIAGAEIYNSIDAALNSCNEENVFIIGGAEIFKQSLEITDVIYRTLVNEKFEADTWFPAFEDKYEMASTECFEPDEKNKYSYCFEKWIRRS